MAKNDKTATPPFPYVQFEALYKHCRGGFDKNVMNSEEPTKACELFKKLCKVGMEKRHGPSYCFVHDPCRYYSQKGTLAGHEPPQVSAK